MGDKYIIDFDQTIYSSSPMREVRQDIEFLRKDIAHLRWLISSENHRNHVHYEETERFTDLVRDVEALLKKCDMERTKHNMEKAENETIPKEL